MTCLSSQKTGEPIGVMILRLGFFFTRDHFCRFENMFMTSLEVEAQNKGLKGLEFQLKLEELERIKAEHQKEVQALEEERNGLEKEVAAD